MASVGGFVAAATVIVVVAFFVVGMGGTTREPFPIKTLARFFGGVAFYLLIVNLLMFTDGLLLKRLVAEWAERRALLHPANYANEQAGFYGAVQNVARIPYQLILAVTFVIFPLVSKSTFDADVERTRGYVRTTMRYSLLVAALFAAVLGSRPEAIMRLFYYVFFSLFNIAGTIINGAGRTLPTTIIGVTTLAITVAAEWVGIRFALDTGSDPLFVAASATAAAMGFGLLLSGVYLWRAFGAFVPLLSVVRVALAYAAAAAVGWAWTRAGILPGKIGTLVSASVAGASFLVVAVLSGELRPAELMRLRRATRP
jgi:stage V sporulation protein B